MNNSNFTPMPEGTSPRMQMYIFNGPTPDRDGDVDAEIILHEYTHGLSNRRVGGGVGIDWIGHPQAGALGEGWSDFYALSLLSEENDDIHAKYAMGGYVTYQVLVHSATSSTKTITMEFAAILTRRTGVS